MKSSKLTGKVGMSADIAIVVTTDGRGDCLEKTMQSLEENLSCWGEASMLIVDDSGLLDYGGWVLGTYSHIATIYHHRPRLGQERSIRRAWQWALNQKAKYVWHQEDDFTFNRPVDVAEMAELLRKRPYVAQMALKRQPVNDAEEAAGGFLQMHECVEKPGFVEWEGIFTLNPSLIPITAIRTAMCGRTTEPEITATLLENGWKFGYLGTLKDPPRVHHIGEHRTAGWRL